VANQADYPPLASAMLWVCGLLARPFHLDTFWTLKTACLVFLLISSALILTLERSILGAILLMPAFMLESTGFAYLDVFYTPLLILAFWALRNEHLKTFSIAIAGAALIKWQPLIILPFLLVHLLKGDNGGFSLKRAWPGLIPGALLALMVLLGYGIENVKLAFGAAIGHHFLSANAFNLGWVITYLLHIFDPARYGVQTLANSIIGLSPDDVIFRFCHLGFMVVYALSLLAFALRKRNGDELLLYAAIGLLSYVMVNPGVHENHSYIAVLLLFLLSLRRPEFRPSAVFAGLILNANLLLFYGLGLGVGVTRPERIVAGFDIAVAFALLNLAFFCALLARHVVWQGWSRHITLLANARA
jgi:hypothetical protein